MAKYSFLEPVKIGPIELRNRIIRPAVAEFICNEDGSVSEQYLEYYRNVARGGTALITPGIAVIDEEAPYTGYKTLFLTEEKYIPGLKQVADAVHAEGAKITYQLWHAGHYLDNGVFKPMVNDLTKADIERLKQKYLTAARNCKKAGADGVEYHIAHTYLPSTFMSTYFNKRTDEYGSDTIENAMRFSIECIDMIRDELCDDNFVITVKLTGDDFVEGGTTAEWAAQGAKLLEKSGVVLLTVNGGGALTGYEYMSDNGHQPEGWKVNLAEAIKKQVSIPVAASGNIRHPEFVDQIIREGKCDLVALGRGTIAEPEWVNKAAQGREDEMRTCISCLYCFNRVAEDGSEPGCSVNPYAKCEFRMPELVKDGNGRVVAIAGAGPAGLEAAVTLAERGFKPIVLDEKPYLGGLVKLAIVPPYKTKLQWMIDYYAGQIKRLGIEVRLNTKATPELLAELKPYAVFLATGTDEIIPSVPGKDQKHVVNVRDLLEEETKVSGKDIVVVGAGMTGIETAHWLLKQGNRVTVVDMLPMSTTMSLADKLTFRDANKDGVKFLFEHRLDKIGEKDITATDLAGGKEVTLSAELVVLSLGTKGENSLYESIKTQFERVSRAGDCVEPLNIAKAVRGGSNIAYALK